MIRPWLGLTATLALAASAQDGGQLYETYCGACHAPNGEGATGGLFPPLAGSEWIEGPAERAIQIVLHGMQGPVEVQGKPYNLIMPPQGAALPDDQIAAILTHVRSSWGNAGSKVTPEMIKKARTVTADRKAPWSAPEILKAYPLPKRPTPLRNLTSRIYHGNWNKLPKFAELTPENVEEEHDGIISLKQSDRKNGFGMVWEADFMAEKDGEYYFRFACDDGGRVLIDDEVALEVHGTGPMVGGRTVACKLDFKAGAHPIRVEYFELVGNEGIGLDWKGPGDKVLKHLTDTATQKTKSGPTPIPVEPTAERAAIYRNFIAGTTPRSIGIGFPGGVNLAYSADHLAPELVWTGDFIDGSKHWVNRGQGAQQPSGEKVVTLTSRPVMPDGSRFHGYRLDQAGNPTFLSSVGDLKVADTFTASGGELIRTITVSGKGDALTLGILQKSGLVEAISSLESASQTDGSIHLMPKGPVKMNITDQLEVTISAPLLRQHDKEQPGFGLLLSPGESATLTYSWK